MKKETRQWLTRVAFSEFCGDATDSLGSVARDALASYARQRAEIRRLRKALRDSAGPVFLWPAKRSKGGSK